MNAITMYLRNQVPCLLVLVWMASAWQSCIVPVAACAEEETGWVFACAAENDLYQVLSASGVQCRRFNSAAEAVQAAPSGTGVLVLADRYPEQLTNVESSMYDEAALKQLRLYVEYPSWLPDMEVGAPKSVKYERGVVTSDYFGEALRPMQIALVSSCHYVPVRVERAHLVAAKVAGVDRAVFGLAGTAAEPLLFDHPRGGLLVATTKLSHFVSGRYLPSGAWRTIWQTILARLHPEGRRVELKWTPRVRPSYGREEQLPDDAESAALRWAADWIMASHALRHPDWPAEALEWALTYNTVREAPLAQWPVGDGSLGILEGYSSTIRYDGRQPMRYAVRNDCCTEVAMMLALDAAVHARPEHADGAAKLLDYIFGPSGLAGGPRANPESPSYGLVGWALDHPGSYWGDDNARALLAVGAVAAMSGEKRWDEPVARCILANFRTTGVHGYRPSCVQEADLQARGWQAYWNSEHTHYSPHFQSWLWACNFWAYEQTRFEPLLARSREALRLMMVAYPER